ncbi:MAG: triose-phosphate isomerase [Bacteroidales bacterium]|nr:triose-phosphate isomerase [Bacteroidales bacterium]
MRTRIVAGNWKMNNTFREAEKLIYEIMDLLAENGTDDVTTVICPPAVFLELAHDLTRESTLEVGAQNLSQFEKGAYTGEISARMLQSVGISYCIIGHSERRKYFNETYQELGQKVGQALKHNIAPIFCCGEQLREREEGAHFTVVEKQLAESLFHLDADAISRVIIAYEPVWAIGTGVNATPDQAQEMHAYIRSLFRKKYGGTIADALSILYGGSCNAENARELFANPDVDGGLIGGASLKASDFHRIIRSFG